MVSAQPIDQRREFRSVVLWSDTLVPIAVADEHGADVDLLFGSHGGDFRDHFAAAHREVGE